jgi:hypothetical protein
LNLLLLLSFISALNAGTPIHWSQQNAAEIVTAYEVHYAIPHHELFDTLNCESALQPRSIHENDGKGDSRGIAQISTYYHPEVTAQEAYDPIWAVSWSAQRFASGHAHEWSCYNQEAYRTATSDTAFM